MTRMTHSSLPDPKTDGHTGLQRVAGPPKPRSKADIALLPDYRYTSLQAGKDDWYLGNILHDDNLLRESLSELGFSSVRVDWADPDIDWSSFSCAVFRTTWDYYERITEFTSWLERVKKLTRLCNNAELIRWNMDKHYLADLQARGIPVVPTRYMEAGSKATLSELLDQTGWSEAIIKPCISGAARHTYRVNRSNAGLINSKVQPLLDFEAFLFQPFLPDILHSGEDTLVLIDGKFTHAVTKRPKPGDFRVQDDHGGTVHHCFPTPEQIQLAEQTLAACRTGDRPVPVYGRVDMVRDLHGDWCVMELELIEPELWLRNHPPAARTLAAAVARYLRE